MLSSVQASFYPSNNSCVDSNVEIQINEMTISLIKKEMLEYDPLYLIIQLGLFHMKEAASNRTSLNTHPINETSSRGNKISYNNDATISFDEMGPFQGISRLLSGSSREQHQLLQKHFIVCLELHSQKDGLFPIYEAAIKGLEILGDRYGPKKCLASQIQLPIQFKTDFFINIETETYVSRGFTEDINFLQAAIKEPEQTNQKIQSLIKTNFFLRDIKLCNDSMTVGQYTKSKFTAYWTKEDIISIACQFTSPNDLHKRINTISTIINDIPQKFLEVNNYLIEQLSLTAKKTITTSSQVNQPSLSETSGNILSSSPTTHFLSKPKDLIEDFFTFSDTERDTESDES